jgi:hypothetical protein
MGTSTRIYVVLIAAAALVATLFAPWYAIDFSGAARDLMSQQAGQVPGPFGEFARGLLSLLPKRIVANGWEVFERTDIVLLGCGLAAGFAALLGRFDVAALAGGGAAVTTLLAIVDKPGPGGGLVQLQWGAWAALAASCLIVVAARVAGDGGERVGSPEPASADWSSAAVVPAAAMLADRPDSVAPPS